jgi:hypothetical protein
MANENINNTAGASGPYNTLVPALADNANIQEALRVYHYGGPAPATIGDVSPTSIAGHFKAMSTRVETLEEVGIGSSYSLSSELPEVIEDGFLWVDKNSSAPTYNTDGTLPLSVVRYQSTVPTGTIPEGALWVDKGSDPLTMTVSDSTIGWRQIGGELS